VTRVGSTGAAGLWLACAAAVLGALAFVVAPVVLLHPFRPQTPLGVAVAFELREAAPLATLGLFVFTVALAVALVRRARDAWPRSVLAALVVLAAGAAWFARQNHFEWMFRPIPDPAYARVAAVSAVADSDMVIAVAIAGDAVAYPVREMAYHHLVNDVVGGRPVVSTY